MSDPHAITILTAARTKRAAKRHTRTPDGGWSTQDYDCGMIFALDTAHAYTLSDLSGILTDLQDDRRAFVVRGARIDSQPAHPSTRRTIHAQDDGTHPDLRETDRAWVCLDIDNLPTPADPDGKPLGDRASWVRHAVAQLPSPFQGAGYHYQWSNSAGVRGWASLRLHLWFLLARPVCGPSLKAYLKAQRAPVDLALCSAAQIHYTAAPLFCDPDGQPTPDPWHAHRCGLVDGPPVNLPPEVQDLAAHTAALDASRALQAQRALEALAHRQDTVATDSALARYVARTVRAILDDLSRAGVGDRHRALYRAAGQMGELIGAGALTHSEALADLTAAAGILYAGEEGRAADAQRAITDGLAKGGREPRDLSHVHDRPPTPARAVPQREARLTSAHAHDPGPPPDWHRAPYPDDDAPTPAQSPDDDAPAYEPPPSFPVCDLGEPRTDPAQTFDLTDEGDGQRLAAAFGHALRYIPDRDAWAYYDTRSAFPCWRLDVGSTRAQAVGHLSRVCAVVAYGIKAEGRTAAERTYTHTRAQALSSGEREDRAEAAAQRARAATLAAYAKHHKSATSIEGRGSMLAVASALPHLRAPSALWDAEPHLLGVANGVIDLRRGVLLPPTPARLMLRRCPHAYDPAAQAPAFGRFLDEITRQQDGQDTTAARDKRTYLLDVLGYVVTGHTDEQAFWTLTGAGGNGKGVLIEALTHVLGSCDDGGYSADIDFSTIAHGHHAAGQARPDLAKLPGARLVVTSEPSRGGQYDEGLVKKVTGQDPITARPLYAPELTYRPVFKLVVLCNAKPTIHGTDDGIWRRVRIVTFDHQWRTSDLMSESLPAPDKTLRARLQGEAEGILALLVASARRWFADGLRTPAQITDQVREYRTGSDTFALFLDEACEQGKTYRVGSSALLAAYNLWAKSTRAPQLNANTLAEEMTRRAYAKTRASAGYVWLGLQLRPDGPPPHTDDDRKGVWP